MRGLVVLVALAACEHGQSPSSEHISLAQMSCTIDPSLVQLQATATVRLEIGQAFDISFLVPLEGVTFQRSTSWDCDRWSPGAEAGCTRAPGNEDIEIVTVTEVLQVLQGVVPSSFELTVVGAILDDEIMGVELETVLVKHDCP